MKSGNDLVVGTAIFGGILVLMHLAMIIIICVATTPEKKGSQADSFNYDKHVESILRTEK